MTDCPDLATAVAAGYRWAQPDGIVLLSPAAPSFGLFKDYRDRAEAFARGSVRAHDLSEIPARMARVTQSSRAPEYDISR